MRKLFQSKADANGRYRGENGSYNATTNTIRLDVNAGANTASELSRVTLLRTMSHELTHALQQNSPAQYEALKHAVLDVLTSKGGASIEEMAARKMEQDSSLKKADVALDEVVAEACENMLRDSDAMEQLIAQHPAEAKTFLEKMKQFFTDIVNAIRAAFGGSGTSRSREATALMQQAEEYLDICEKWSKALQDAAEISGRMDRQTGDGDVQYQARVGYTEDGLPVYTSNFPEGSTRAQRQARILQLVQDVWSKTPIKLQIMRNGHIETITARFDPYVDPNGNINSDATKLAYGNRKGTMSDQKVTEKLADDFPEIISNSTYDHSTAESGKGTYSHRGVTVWHYFANRIGFVNERQNYAEYNVYVDVKEKSEGDYVYSFAAIKQKGSERTKAPNLYSDPKTINASVNGLKPAIANTSIAPSDGSVKYSLRENVEQTDDIRYQLRDEDGDAQGLVGIFDEAPRLEEAHIDQRTWDNMSDRRVHSFMNDYPASRIWLARMASVLQSDVSATTAGQRFMNEEGTFMGQKRDTTPLLAEMKDSGYTWQQMADVFGKMAEVFENGDLEGKVPETAIWKRAELILDRAVTEGYTDMNGIEYRPDAGYMRYKDELPGAKAREIPANAVNDTFEDVDNRLSGGETAAAQTGGDGERVQLQGDTAYQEKQRSAKSGVLLMDGEPSNRELLSSALESAAQTPEELRYVQSYKKQAQKIAEMEGLLAERRAEVQRLQDMKNRTADQEIRMKNLQTSIAETESMIDKRDKGLLKMEAMEPLRNVLDRERANYRETLKQAKKDAAARQREKDAAKLDNALLATQMHEGREWAAKLHEAENRVAEANQKVEDLKAQSLADRMHESSEWAAKLRKAENQLATAKRQLETAQMQRIAERMAEGRKWANEKLLKTITISRSFGTPSGARTLDTLIKSQVLYQLS